MTLKEDIINIVSNQAPTVFLQTLATIINTDSAKSIIGLDADITIKTNTNIALVFEDPYAAPNFFNISCIGEKRLRKKHEL